VGKLMDHRDSYRTCDKQLETDLAAAKKAIDQLEGEQQRVAGILVRPDRFCSRPEIQGPDGSGGVTIKVFRKKLAAKDFPSSPHIDLELGFGSRPRFALAAGAAYSPLDSLEFGSVQAFALDREGEVILDRDGDPMLTSTLGHVDVSG